MLKVSDLMHRDPKTVSPNLPINDLEARFLTSGFTGFPVVDEGRLVGFVSRSDIVRSLLTERSRAEQVSDFSSSMGDDDEEIEARSVEVIAAQVGVRLARLKVSDVMIRTVIQIDSSESIALLAKVMREGHLHRLPVVEDERLVGLVTSMDLVAAIADGRFTEADRATDSTHLLT